MMIAPLPPGALAHVGRCRRCLALVLFADSAAHMRWHMAQTTDVPDEEKPKRRKSPKVSDVGHPEPPREKRKRIRPSTIPNPALDKGMERIKEKWEPIRDWEGFYEISTRGEVRSVNRITKAGSAWKGRKMRPNIGRGGRLRVVLSDAKRKEYAYIDELVREMFVGPETFREEVHV